MKVLVISPCVIEVDSIEEAYEFVHASLKDGMQRTEMELHYHDKTMEDLATVFQQLDPIVYEIP